MNVRILYGCICLLTLASCIKNDVPYPYIPGNILEMTVEGQTGETEIDVAKNIVNITVDGNVDVDSLKVLKLKISDKAMMTPDSAACVKFEMCIRDRCGETYTGFGIVKDIAYKAR